MKTLDRRKFLKTSALALGAGLISRTAPPVHAQPIGSNDAIRLGLIGVGRKGRGHIETILKTPGVRLVAICDVDPRELAKHRENLSREKVSVFTTTDARVLLERADVDAVLISSPNHWHALQTVWACQAGKDVYVEKPISHNPWEGVQMVRAAARYNRVAQTGTQMRSDIAMPQVIEYLRSGEIGKMQWVHSLCYKFREGIGRRLPWYPDWLDYDMFCGPAPVVPLVRDELHYDWHWQWDTGNGDLSNLGIHEFDVGRWVAGHAGGPRRILSLGGRFAFQDTGETPNTQLTVFDYPGLPVILENRVLPAKPGVRYTDHVHGVRQGIYVQCEGGYFAGRYGGAIYDKDGKKIKSFQGDGGENHIANFISAVRSRQTASLAAPLETGRVSTSPCHFGNISYRLGRSATLAEAHRALESVPASDPLLDGMAKHLAVHGVPVNDPVFTVGPWLEIDPGLAEVASIEGADKDTLALARHYVQSTPRPPYVLTEQA
ncbi:MAG TPA: Gfo/Idh/MocA family oxidoreductase [Opitutaceae bacterium]